MAKLRKTVYCEYEFWKRFTGINTSPSITEQTISTMQRWISIYNFLSRSNILFDISVQELQNLIKTDRCLFMLWKKYVGAECGLNCVKDTFVHLNSIQTKEMDNYKLNAMYLTCGDTELSDKIASNYGIAILNVNTLDKSDSFFDEKTIPIKKTFKKKPDINWHDLSKTNHKCNALAIIDRYLLKSNNSIKYNLIPILDIYLPEQISVTFNISIFTDCLLGDAKTLYDNVHREISKLRPNLKFTFGLFNMNSKLHDREIITNYMHITSGSGFDLIDLDKTGEYLRFIHQTSITACCPFTLPLSDAVKQIEVYNNLCESLKDIISKCMTNDYYGNKENRILD